MIRLLYIRESIVNLKSLCVLALHLISVQYADGDVLFLF